jgi:hypothetical protein
MVKEDRSVGLQIGTLWPRKRLEISLSGNKIGVFTRRQASQAAMKAANRGPLDDPLEEAVFSCGGDDQRARLDWNTRLIISFGH